MYSANLDPLEKVSGFGFTNAPISDVFARPLSKSLIYIFTLLKELGVPI